MDVLVEVGFKVHRGMITERAVEPHAVVKDFDPLEDGRAGFATRGELAAMNEFAFQSAPKTFHHRVVITVTASAHAGNDSGLGESLPVSGTGVLFPAITVMHQACGWSPLLQRHVQRCQWQRGGQRVTQLLLPDFKRLDIDTQLVGHLVGALAAPKPMLHGRALEVLVVSFLPDFQFSFIIHGVLF